MDCKHFGVASVLLLFTLGNVLSAAQPLVIEATIAEVRPAGKNTVSKPRILVENGRLATIQIGDAARELEFSITPNLQPDGNVMHTVTIRQIVGGATTHIAAPKVTAKLNQLVEIQVGELSVALHTVLAK